MSKLYLSASNERGSKATKCANKFMDVHISTLKNGILVEVDIKNGIAHFNVYKTNGSDGISGNFKKIAIYSDQCLC